MWAPGLVWSGAENLAPTGIPSPDRPVRSESLYPLSYPGPQIYVYNLVKTAVFWDVAPCSVCTLTVDLAGLSETSVHF